MSCIFWLMNKTSPSNLASDLLSVDFVSIAGAFMLSRQIENLMPPLNLAFYMVSSSAVLLIIFLTLRICVGISYAPIRISETVKKRKISSILSIGMLINLANIDAIGMSKTSSLPRIGQSDLYSLDNVVTRFFIAFQILLFATQAILLLTFLRQRGLPK